MASLPTLTRIQKEDLGKDAPEWINGILSVMNQFMEEIYQSYNRNLTIPENVAGQIKTIDIATTNNYTSGNFAEIRFSSELKRRMTILLIGQVVQSDDPTVKYDYCFPSWEDNNGTIVVRYISGLADSKKYKITFLGI
jgi:hypothetical protein